MVTGVSANADMVTVTLDGGTDILVEGDERWSALIDAQTATLGAHTVTVRASGADGDHEDTVSFEVVAGGSHTSGEQVDITYSSSVDGQQLGANLFLPPNYDAEADGPLPLVLFLHGANNDGAIAGPLLSQMSQRRWIGIGPDGRFWGVGQDPDCAWAESVAFVDSDDPDVGPGAQDMLDAVTWVKENYPVDPRRIYAVGFSMGGRGAYTIALTNPHIFAGIGAVAPGADMFDSYNRVTVSQTCLEGLMGGGPRDSAMVDTMFKITSPRFLLESAYNVPVHHAHGLADTLSYNIAGTDGQFLAGWHMTVDDSWDGCHDDAMELCFGHTPTLQELSARHPEGYDWAYLFGEGGHGNDPQFFAGGPAENDEVGTVNPDNPSELLGIGDFLDGRVRNDAPETVVYKTYTDRDRDAFWLSLDSATPWQDLPAGVRASRDSTTNAVTAELSRADALTIDLDLAGLTIAAPVTVTIDELSEAVFDPALTMGAGESLTPRIVLEGDFSAVSDVEVLGDVRDPDRLELAMREVDYVIHAAALKHVPAAEYNPFECIKTNVNGAENVVNAALRCGVRRVVALSTDKAANPINLYGASKLASDKIFVAANSLAGGGRTRFAVVRYGNVIGSRGSVVPLFRRLIAEGATELPITDTRMTRFWITLDQGVNFVLSSLAMMHGGEIFVPRIPSTSVADMARAMAPDLPHRIIGIRPGEKLHEVLISEDDARTTRDIGDRFIIAPAFSYWTDKGIEPAFGGAPVAEGFRYTSDDNPEQMPTEALMDLIAEAPE